MTYDRAETVDADGRGSAKIDQSDVRDVIHTQYRHGRATFRFWLQKFFKYPFIEFFFSTIITIPLTLWLKIACILRSHKAYHYIPQLLWGLLSVTVTHRKVYVFCRRL